MQTRVVRLLLILLGVRGLAACSVPEAAAVPNKSEAQRDHQIEREQRALDRRRLRLQRQMLSDLRALRESRDGATEQVSDHPSEHAEYRLLIFGGASHEVYLGCLCDAENPESVFNLTGEFGSDLSQNSMRNKFAPYGSNNEDTSACSATATHPPSVLASDGKSLGLLTLNPSLKRRISVPSVAGWLARMCSY